MADTKISALPSATTPLTGAELVPLVQTGGNVKVSVDNLTAGRAVSALSFAGPLNGTVGATTANTGAFTTLTTSSTVTLNGGTANGVAYLNGSKVLTTGSALTFDGAGILVSGVGGSGTNNSALRLNGSDASSYGSYIQFQRNSVNKWTIGTDSGINGGTSDDLTIFGTASQRFYASSAEQMRLTSTGLGIGTSSPAAKLHVVGGAKLTGTVVTTTGSDAFSAGNSTGISTRVNALFQGTDALGNGRVSYIGTNIYGTDGSLELATNVAGLIMTLNNSGNVGIGTASPSASAILDAQSTTKGVRMPNMTTTQKNAIASPAAGLMVFDTTLAKLCVYSGAAWQTITSI